MVQAAMRITTGAGDQWARATYAGSLATLMQESTPEEPLLTPNLGLCRNAPELLHAHPGMEQM